MSFDRPKTCIKYLIFITNIAKRAREQIFVQVRHFTFSAQIPSISEDMALKFIILSEMTRPIRVMSLNFEVYDSLMDSSRSSESISISARSST